MDGGGYIIFRPFDIIFRTQTHEHNETIFYLSHFPVLYQYKSKVMFHTLWLVYIMCPIFKIDKLDWFGFQRRNIHFFWYYIPT